MSRKVGSRGAAGASTRPAPEKEKETLTRKVNRPVKPGVTPAPVTDWSEPVDCRPRPIDDDFKCPKCGVAASFDMDTLVFKCKNVNLDDKEKDCGHEWVWAGGEEWSKTEDGKKWLDWKRQDVMKKGKEEALKVATDRIGEIESILPQFDDMIESYVTLIAVVKENKPRFKHRYQMIIDQFTAAKDSFTRQRKNHKKQIQDLRTITLNPEGYTAIDILNALKL